MKVYKFVLNSLLKIGTAKIFTVWYFGIVAYRAAALRYLASTSEYLTNKFWKQTFAEMRLVSLKIKVQRKLQWDCNNSLDRQRKIR